MKSPVKILRKKIAILGFPEFVKEVIYNLKGTPFLLENDIDILFVKTKTKKTLFWYFKKYSWDKVIYLKDSFLYKNEISELIRSMYPQKDISFIDSYGNVKERAYGGLDTIENMQQYDFFFVATFSGRIPERVINKPKHRIFNIHLSFFPELRGGYPTYVDSYMHKSYSGVSIHIMEMRWDAGPICVQTTFDTDPQATNQQRVLLAAEKAAELLNQMQASEFEISSTVQNDDQATHCSRVLKAKRELNTILPGESLEGFVRANMGSHLFPFTYCVHRFSVFSILKIERAENVLPEKYNTVVRKVIEYEGSYFINHDSVTYRIESYFYRGKLYSS